MCLETIVIKPPESHDDQNVEPIPKIAINILYIIIEINIVRGIEKIILAVKMKIVPTS